MPVIPTNTKYTSGSNVYTFPVGCTFIIVELVGQGGSGGTGNTFAYNGGGGAGGWYVKKLYLPLAGYTCDVGDAANGILGIPEVGGNYGDYTSFDFLTVTRAGGGGGGFPGFLVGTKQGSGGKPFDTFGADNFTGTDIIIDIPGGHGGAGGLAVDYGRSGCGGRSFYSGNTLSKTSRFFNPVTSLNLTNGSGSMSPSLGFLSNQGSNGVAYITEYYTPIPPTFTKLLGGGNTGIYTSPSGCAYITVEIVGGGGNSGQCFNARTNGGGGGGGAYIRKDYLAGSYNYEVGGWGDKSIFSSEQAGPGDNGVTPTVDAEYASGGKGGTVTVASGSFLDVEGEGGTCSREYTAGAGGASYLSGRGPSAWSTSYVAGLGRALRYGGGASSNINDPNRVLGADGAIFITEWYGSSGSSNSINRHIDRVNTVDGRNINNDVSLVGRFINRKSSLSRTIDRVIFSSSAFSIPTVTKITSGAGNYTSPAGCVYIIVEMVGGGGSGGKGYVGGSGPVSGGGGGGGAYIRKTKPPGVYAYSVGAGGASIAVGVFTNGNTGGTSAFSTESCFGGVGGFYAGGFLTEGNGGSGGDVSGGSVAPFISSIGSGGSASGLDSAGSIMSCGIGGSSKFSGCPLGVFSLVAVAGLAGSLYGGGGNGSIGDTATGAGASGLIFITEYYS